MKLRRREGDQTVPTFLSGSLFGIGFAIFMFDNMLGGFLIGMSGIGCAFMSQFRPTRRGEN